MSCYNPTVKRAYDNETELACLCVGLRCTPQFRRSLASGKPCVRTRRVRASHGAQVWHNVLYSIMSICM